MWHLLHPFICSWIFRLLPCLGYCEEVLKWTMACIYTLRQHWLNGHGFEQTQQDNEGQEGLACCSSWVHEESETTERLNKATINTVYAFNLPLLILCSLCFLFYFMSFIKIIKACSIKSQIMLSHKEKSYLNHHHKFFILEAISFNNCKVLFLLYSSIFLYKFHLILLN